MVGGFRSAVGCIKGKTTLEKDILVQAIGMGRTCPVDKSLVMSSDMLLGKTVGDTMPWGCKQICR